MLLCICLFRTALVFNLLRAGRLSLEGLLRHVCGGREGDSTGNCQPFPFCAECTSRTRVTPVYRVCDKRASSGTRSFHVRQTLVGIFLSIEGPQISLYCNIPRFCRCCGCVPQPLVCFCLFGWIDADSPRRFFAKLSQCKSSV